jgi:hypothetical protein
MKRYRCSIVLLPLLLAPAAVPAADPTAEAIMDKSVEATGGRAAWDKLKTEVAKGSLELTAMGMKGDLTMYKAAPDKSYTVIDFPGFGKAEEGSNGQVAWASNAMQGARIKEGDERAMALRNASLQGDAHWRDFYKKAELAGTEDVDGKPCYKVILTPNEGSQETRYYDKSSGLLVKALVPLVTQEGPVTAEARLADYRDEGGLLLPHTITQKLPNTDIIIKIDSFKHGETIPDNRFDLPDDVKALVNKKP